ncbi:MAG: alpha/beta fold hydrolase [Brevinema sp.]
MKKYLLLLSLFVMGCSVAPDGDLLYMKYGNSYFPIYVRGNANADATIIWVHGGPGSSGLYYGDMPEVAQLHKKYRVVYWDQLSSGGTFGNPDKSEFTISNFAHHMQGIVNIVQKKYSPRKMFVLGHSWGGMLGAYYLAEDSSRQTQFDGFINLNAVWDIQDALQHGATFVTNYAKDQISAGKDVKKWEKMIKWYQSKNGVYLGQDVTDHFNNVDDAGGMVVKKDRRDELTAQLTMKMVFNSPFEFYSYYDSQRAIRTYLDIANCSLVSNTKPINVGNITIPTMVMSGVKDRIASPDDTTNWFAILGSSVKHLVSYTNSAHATFIDEPKEFFETVDSFIQNTSLKPDPY